MLTRAHLADLFHVRLASLLSLLYTCHDLASGAALLCLLILLLQPLCYSAAVAVTYAC
jgi:hypothetical protein